jgi:MFS transporter, DHA2 family, multidrug resistance protein
MADSFEPAKRGLAFALYGLVAVLAPSIGPTLGGWITDNYSWHWIFYINIPVGILAIFLTNRLVEDPPYQKSDRRNLYRIDSIGVGLLVIAMGALQITLDKGEEKNWFGSHFIVTFATAFIISFIALIIWEFHTERPLIDLRLFKFKNFAVCAFLMLLTGGLLNATTVLQPQFLQQQLGYTATIAGLSLSGGGLVLLLAMPMAGQLVSRFPARNLIAMGFVMFACGYFYTAKHISLLISFGFASKLRVVQIIAIPFVFISVTTAAYFGIPPEKNNQVSGLINFVRNIGGSILISLTNALVTERAQWHQDTLSKNTILAGSNYQQQIDALRGTLDVTAGKANGLHLAQGQLYQQLQAQTQALAYVDVYYVLAFAAVLMVPLAFLLDKNRPGGGAVMME